MHERTQAHWWRSNVGIALTGFSLIAAFYVLREHYAHALGALPYMLLLACPLMHLFMHHGHHDQASGLAKRPAAPTGR